MNIKKAGKLSFIALSAFVVGVLLSFSQSLGLDYYWVGSSGSWDDPSKWSPNGQPQDGDTVYLTQSGIRVGLFAFTASYYHRLVFQNGRWLKVHGDVGEGGLKTDPGWNIYVKYKFLESLLDLPVIQVVISDERGEEGVKIREGLGPSRFSLQGIEEIYDLPQGRA